jgi:aspartyl-tRNA(Asn)/glutamyl-tRNA(Gln) amidotransferase subunit B
MRSDVNVSVRPVGQKELGAKVEIKNMNSFAFIREAIEYEIERQTTLLESGGTVVQETRGYDPDRGETFSQRTKENAHDYRYFPEPDLMPVKIPAEQVEQWRSELPELPAQRRKRYVEGWGLPEYDAGVLTADKAVSDWFEEAMEYTQNAKAVSNFIMGEMMRLLSEAGSPISTSQVTPKKLAEIIALIDAKTISTSAGKQVFEIIFHEGGDPKAIVEAKGMAQVSDDSALEGWANDAINNNPQSVAEYKSGKQGAINFLMGQVMKASRGKANPAAVMQMLKQKLDA